MHSTEQLVPVTDAAFLYKMYVCLLCGIPMPAGWYAEREHTNTCRHIRNWMESNMKDTEKVKVANNDLRTYMEPLKDKLTQYVFDDDEEDGCNSDASCDL